MNNYLPRIPYEDWTETRLTVHLILQIMGKIKMSLMPRKNHWWNITIHVDTKGFTTNAIPTGKGAGTFQLTLNVHDLTIEILPSTGRVRIIELSDGVDVATVYDRIFKELSEIDIEPNISSKPFDMPVTDKFQDITQYHHYDKDYLLKFWESMCWTNSVFTEFGGRFYGKSSVSQIFWHHMDMAITRFSGKRLPDMGPEARVLEKDAYSHEVISFGYWVGDDNMQEPAYYAYAFPSPEGLSQESLLPEYAYWIESNGNPMAILPYHKLIESSSPRQDLLIFLETFYQKAGELANWDLEANKVPELGEL